MRDFETGIVYVNAGTTGAETHLPFGGWKETGNGHREAGHAALDSYTEWKSIYVDFSGRLQRAQIDNQGVDELTPSAPARRFVALLGAWMLAGCVDVVSTVDPVPCWQPGGDFDFRPVTVEGVLQVDSEANGLFIRMPDGREYDIGFPDGYRVILESGTGRVDTPAGRTMAEAGDSLRLWGGDTHIGEEPIPPAPMGRRGLIVCMIDGQQVRDANGRTIGRS